MAAKVARWTSVVVFAIFSIVLIGVSAAHIGPAWAAHLGHGERGTFTAYAKNCSQRPCAWFGTFTGSGGVNSNGLQIASGGNISHVGQVVPALKVGSGDGEVYPGNGGTDWIYMTLLMGGGVALVCIQAFFWTRSLRRRAAGRRALIS
jgi:hypothetical protein